MGGSPSRPDVDLLPPRFDRTPPSGDTDAIATSPFYSRFGTAARHRVLNSLLTGPSEVHVTASMHPDYEESSQVTATVAVADAALRSGAFRFRSSRVEGSTTLAASAAVSTSSAATVAVSALNLQRGIAAYALLPLDASASSARCAALGSSAPCNVAELGARFLASDATVGVHVAPSHDVPFRAWAVGAAGALEAGVQVTSTGRALLAARDVPALRSSLALDAAVSVRQPGLYEVSLALDAARGAVVAGYVHSMTARRAVYNPLAEEHVKGIYNYVDVAVELSRAIAAPHGADVALGCAWQVNRNVLVKGRVGTRGVSVAAGVKSWWDPAITAAITASIDTVTGRKGVGLSLQIEKGGAVQYNKGIAGYQTVAANRAMTAQPQLSERTGSNVDTAPLAPPPTPAAAAVDSNGARWL